MVQPNIPILPNGDNPTRVPRKSYVDKFGLNPMKASYENCFVKTSLGLDPITGKPVSVWEEQIDREKQLLESIGELCLFFRYDVTQSAAINGGQRNPLTWDSRRGQARYNAAELSNTSGIVTNDPHITKVQGYEWYQNPEVPSGMFWTHLNMTTQKLESKDTGFEATHAPNYWTVPIRNGQGNIVNFLQNMDVMIRFIFDDNGNPIRELERLVLVDMNYSVAPSNQLLHMAWNTQRPNPGIDTQIFALPNFLT